MVLKEPSAAGLSASSIQNLQKNIKYDFGDPLYQRSNTLDPRCIKGYFCLSFHLMASLCDRSGFSGSSISPDEPITLESYIFGCDIIHNSSINSTSHFLSVSRTFLTLSPHAHFYSLHSSFTSHTSSPLATSRFLVHNSPSSPSIVVGLWWFIESFSVEPALSIVYWGSRFFRRRFWMIWCLCLLMSDWRQT